MVALRWELGLLRAILAGGTHRRRGTRHHGEGVRPSSRFQLACGLSRGSGPAHGLPLRLRCSLHILAAAFSPGLRPWISWSLIGLVHQCALERNHRLAASGSVRDLRRLPLERDVRLAGAWLDLTYLVTRDYCQLEATAFPRPAGDGCFRLRWLGHPPHR